MSRPSFFWQLKWLILILAMMILDFSPFPVSSLVLLYIFLFKPAWFKIFIDRLYSSE
ncbi:MAG: hypothetical protein M0Q44_13915 [Methylobacter sp.]|jgi:hypothetical protein|nr:hypothetical protein [Methylobacter sp.]